MLTVVGLCLFGYGLIAANNAKDGCMVNGVLGFIFTFVTVNWLGIITAVISLVDFLCAIATVRN